MTRRRLAVEYPDAGMLPIIHSNACRLDDLRPFRQFGPNQRGELIG
jgi:hypothetical protein